MEYGSITKKNQGFDLRLSLILKNDRLCLDMQSFLSDKMQRIEKIDIRIKELSKFESDQFNWKPTPEK